MDDLARPNPDQPPPSGEGAATKVGFVDLVGAGPGDPDLITRKGAAALSRADAVVYDHLVHPRLLEHAPPTSVRIFAGKSRGKCALKQDEINRLLVTLAERGNRVVRLKGGDPYVFGRGAEEAEHLLAAGIPFRVIPGVTAGVGVTAAAGIPVTHRGIASAVAFVTGHADPGAPTSRVDWQSLAAFPGTLVVYMGVSRLGAICEALIHGGKAPSTQACVIQDGTLNSQKALVGTLGSLPAIASNASISPPALLVVGEVIARRQSLSWFERRPLFGQRIVVTRPSDPGGASDEALESLGAEIIQAPMVQILPVEDTSELDAAILSLDRYDWIVFTSANGVGHFLARMLVLGRDARAFAGTRIAAIGPKTSEALMSYHLRADLVPRVSRSEGLVEELRPHVQGARVLLARADRGRDVLRDELGRIASVDQIPVYRNVDAVDLPSGLAERILKEEIHWITITSSAIVARLHDLLPAEARARVGRSVKLASLSPLSTEAANRLGWPVAAQAESSTWEALTEAIVRHASGPTCQRNSL